MELDSWFVELVREELQALETQHPNRFDFLKTELRSLMLDPDLSENIVSDCETISSSASTQRSSNRKRKRYQPPKDEDCFREAKEFVEISVARVDTVIERAEACLQKIQEMKRSFKMGRY